MGTFAMSRITDKQRLNWLSVNCRWIEQDGVIGIGLLPSESEDGQTVRQAIDVAVRAERQKKRGGRK